MLATVLTESYTRVTNQTKVVCLTGPLQEISRLVTRVHRFVLNLIFVGQPSLTLVVKVESVCYHLI